MSLLSFALRSKAVLRTRRFGGVASCAFGHGAAGQAPANPRGPANRSVRLSDIRIQLAENRTRKPTPVWDQRR